MHIKNSIVSIKSYLDLSQLLIEYRGSHEDNRSFALKHRKLEKAPTKLLLKWLDKNYFRIDGELNSKRYLDYLLSISSVLGLIFFILGFIVGLGLLSYDGKLPVNVIYYLFIAMFIPLFSMTLSTISIFSSDRIANLISLLFPLHWIEKILNYLPFRKKLKGFKVNLSFKLSKLLFIERLQLFSLIFSIGLLLSLLIMVIATDIAFGWSTTLQVAPEAFHKLIKYIGLFWDKIIPSAIPSLDLVEMSHYFRLGEKLDISMVHNADKLGAWWKFLAMTTLIYAIAFRFIFWLFTKEHLKKQLEESILSLKGVDKILREFNTPYVSTQAPQKEKHLEIVEAKKEVVIKKREAKYKTILGWNFSKDEILLANDAKKIDRADNIWAVGGSNSFNKDLEIVKNSSGVVLLYVKSWEPPTMDFIDILEILIENSRVKRVEIYPLGTIGRYYKNEEEHIDIWRRKIESIDSQKVWIINHDR